MTSDRLGSDVARPWAADAEAARQARAVRRRWYTSPLYLAFLVVPAVLVAYGWARVGMLERLRPGSVGLLLLVLVVGAGIARVGRWFQDRRHERLAAWGRARGWSYLRHDRDLLRVQRGAPFHQGDAHAATEVLHRPWHGRHAVSFTYAWTTGSGDERRTSYAHVVGLHLPVALPRVEVIPEGLGAKVARLAGGQDLQLELEEFNRAYRVVADDPRTAHAVLHPRLMERLLRPDVRGARWRLEGRWLLTWEPGTTDVERVEPMLHLVSAVADAVPRHVWQDHGHDPLLADPR